MNAAQAHLALNHLPVLLPLVGIVVLAAGMYRRSEELKKAGLLFLIVAGVAAIPTYLTGEPAEAIAKNYPGVSRDAIHLHEDAAWISIIGLEFAALGALFSFVLLVRQKAVPVFLWAFVLLAAASSFALFVRTAHLGGLIRHEELQLFGAGG